MGYGCNLIEYYTDNLSLGVKMLEYSSDGRALFLFSQLVVSKYKNREGVIIWFVLLTSMNVSLMSVEE